MDTNGSIDYEQMDTLPLPSTFEGDLDPVTSKSTLLEPRYKVYTYTYTYIHVLGYT